MAYCDFLDSGPSLPPPRATPAGGHMLHTQGRLSYQCHNKPARSNGGCESPSRGPLSREIGRSPMNTDSLDRPHSHSALDRRLSLNACINNSSRAPSQCIPASQRPVFGAPASPMRRSGSLGLSGPPSPKSACQSPQPQSHVSKVKGLEMKLQSTFERNLSGFRSGASSIADTGSSYEETTTGSNPELFGASAPEDVENDAALGAFLAATNAAARNRRQRAAEDVLPRSQQLLSQQATRRNRRMSSDSTVCETRPMVEALQGSNLKAKREAAKQIRNALKDGPENRMRLVGSGGVRPLVFALKCKDTETVEHAAAAILFLCMSRDMAAEVVSNGGVRMLIEAVALDDPLGEPAKSNAAAALFALSQREDTKRMIYTQGAVKPLVNLLKSAKTQRGKKDSCLALFNIASCPRAAEDLVRLGAVERAVELLEEAEDGVEEKCAALMGALSKTVAGLKAILQNEDALYALADTVEGGTQAAAEHSAVALHQLAAADPRVVPKILAEGCLPPLVRLATQSKKGSDARLLLDILRDYCKKKAKEDAKRQAEERPARPLSRLGNSNSYMDGYAQRTIVSRDSLMTAWTANPTAVSS